LAIKLGDDERRATAMGRATLPPFEGCREPASQRANPAPERISRKFDVLELGLEPLFEAHRELLRRHGPGMQIFRLTRETAPKPEDSWQKTPKSRVC